MATMLREPGPGPGKVWVTIETEDPDSMISQVPGSTWAARPIVEIRKGPPIRTPREELQDVADALSHVFKEVRDSLHPSQSPGLTASRLGQAARLFSQFADKFEALAREM